ncbi:VOC family protein [Vibrio salinus]|uniref:VOC family protein n=1 Tax=Vibrio salinus TaxID=2899784 RepID=UPI001E380632|nr:VOC family protein [Vibrio salinus]MCE0494567.1 VOC family protein [Vibrio salinus]
MDHIALRVNDEVTARQLEAQWYSLGTVLSNADINGRPIFIFKLRQTIKASLWQVRCVEFPYPKPGKIEDIIESELA